MNTSVHDQAVFPSFLYDIPLATIPGHASVPIMRRLEPRLIPLDALLLSLILHFYCFVAFFSFLDFPFDTLVWGEKSGYRVGKKNPLGHDSEIIV